MSTKLKVSVQHNSQHKKKSRGPKAGVDVQFVIDVSGSMAGPKLITAIAGMFYPERRSLISEEMKQVFSALQSSDKVGLVAFGNDIKTQVKMGKKKETNDTTFEKCAMGMGTYADIPRCLTLPDARGTNLYGAIKHAIEERKEFMRGIEQRKQQYNRPYEMVVLTDGENNRGTVTLEEVKSLIKEPGVPHFHLLVIGIGLQVSGRRILLDMCSVARHCEAFVDGQDSAEAIRAAFEKWRRNAATRVAQHYNVKIEVDAPGALDLQAILAAVGRMQLGQQLQPQLIQGPRPTGQKQQICTYFQQNRCRFGAACAFKHEKPIGLLEYQQPAGPEKMGPPGAQRPPTFAVYAANLYPKMEMDDVRRVFSTFGQGITDHVKMKPSDDGMKWAIVNFYRKEDADAAIATLNDKAVRGTVWKVSYHKQKK